MENAKRKLVRIPRYSLGETLFNAISHGVGAALSIPALVLMVLKANRALPEAAVSLFGASMIVLYTISCVYHALSPELAGKRVLRVLDHCNVFLLVFGTYAPVSLLGVGGARGWALFGLVLALTALGIVLTAVDLEKYQTAAILCHLLSGWSILLGIPALRETMGAAGLLWLILGGILYTAGAVLYGIGKRKKYRHCVFHVFCLLGTFCHFWAVYMYLL